MHSLSRRLLVSVSLPLILFFGATIAVFDASFRDLSEHSLRTQLDAQMVALIAAAEAQPTGVVTASSRNLESRLENPGSGLYAQIRDTRRRSAWRSPSATGTFLDFGSDLPPGERRFTRSTVEETPIAIESRGIEFEDEQRSTHALTFSVATSLAPYEEQLWSFRKRLFGWFVGLTAILLATLGALLRWVLGPVRRLEREIHAVEEGSSMTLGAGYPRELSGVAANLNALLVGERRRVARYRDTLGNLAHSLKTPLAVMSATIGTAGQPSPGTLRAQIDRMSSIVEHQLKRAAASGGALLGQAPIPVAPVLSELRATLLKVHGAKDFSIEMKSDDGARFTGDRDDLLELLGNLLDNACKWCRSRIVVTAQPLASGGPRDGLELTVEDDGPGISKADSTRVFERGVRTDESVQGHGIGLAMVRDTVELYGGSLELDGSPLGGARIRVRLPARQTLNSMP